MHYPNAPIEEAVLDFRVVLPESSDVQGLKRLAESLTAEFPDLEEIWSWGGEIQFGKEGVRARQAEGGLRGYRVKSPDQLQVAQFRIDGFTFNRLRPYSAWEEVYPIAIRLWRMYVDASSPVDTTRIALRYINRFEVPVKSIDDARDFITFSPSLPDGLSLSGLESYESRSKHKVPKSGLETILTQSIGYTSPGGELNVIIDIDTFIMRSFSGNEEELERVFNTLRSQKNQIFEGCITPETRRLFE